MVPAFAGTTYHVRERAQMLYGDDPQGFRISAGAVTLIS